MADPNDDSLKQTICWARAEVQALMHEESAFVLYKLRRKHYETGEKAGKMLAYQLKKREQKHSISALRDDSGEILRDHDIINDKFKTFFSSLYKSEYNVTQQERDLYFANLPLPKLDEQQKQSLDAPISAVEILDIIKCLSNGKAPGGDGYTTEFFKIFFKRVHTTISNSI